MPRLSLEHTVCAPGTVVLVRTDFNVPLEDGIIQDDFKIIASLPTIRYLIRQKAKIVLVSHLGRPNGKRDSKLSLRPVATYLEKKLRTNVLFIDPSSLPAARRWPAMRKAAECLPNGGVMLLENIRFFAGEEGARGPLARQLASCADVFVLDGFGVAHRAAASVSGVAKYLPSYSGLLLEREVGALEKVMDKPRHPLVLVLGGAKIETKFSLLEEFVKRADTIILGGAFVSAYLAAQGHKVGGFIGDKKIYKKLLTLVQHGRVVFPVDMVVGDTEGKRTRVVPISNDFSVPDTQEFLYDIGPETLRHCARILAQAHTIIWNGAMGKFEVKAYRKGTVGLIRQLVDCAHGGADVIVGGGETVEIVRAERAASHLSLVSTGGGAMLEFLSKKNLPGIRALELVSRKKSSKK